MKKYKHMCKMCRKEFDSESDDAKYCSRECYAQHRLVNSKVKTIKCPICCNMFKQKRSNQIFCSVACRVKSTENKEKCVCDYCGQTFWRKPSEVEKHNAHYCSKECQMSGMYWSQADTKILQDNYGKVPYEDMVGLFSTPKDVDAIKRRAVYIGLTESRKWTQDEINILIKYYPAVPVQDVMAMLPNKTLLSIRGQAKAQGLKSFYYLRRIYTIAEEEYLKNNYLNKSNEELGEALGREPNAIGQHLWVLGLKRPHCVDNYTGIAEYVRAHLYAWKNEVRERNNYTCALTGVRSNIVIHHIYGFNLLLAETISNIDLPIYDDLTQYSEQQLSQLVDEFLSLQEYYGQYICITENIHKHFHSIYGCGNNTQQQWIEFVDTYYKQ